MTLNQLTNFTQGYLISCLKNVIINENKSEGEEF